MQANAFDDAVRAQYEGGSLPQAVPDWEGLARQLDKPAKKAFAWWYYAGAAAVVGAIVLIMRMALPPVAVREFAGHNMSAPNHVMQPVVGATNPSNNVVPVVTAALPVLQQPMLQHKQAMQPEVQPERTVPEGFQEQASVPVTETPKPIKNVSVFSAPKHDAGYTDLRGMDEPINAGHPKPSLSLLGGVQSGSLHTGYTVGVTVQQGVGKRFSVGGSVAMVSAVAQQSLTLTAAGYQAFSPGPNTTITGGGSQATTTNLYYLQVAPTVHYSITKKLLLATGPDYQHLLQDASSKTLIYEDNKAQLAPINDFGWNSGLDYAITNHLLCGFRYRAGVNNWVQPAAGQLNRNYLQAHLSVRLTR